MHNLVLLIVALVPVSAEAVAAADAPPTSMVGIVPRYAAHLGYVLDVRPEAHQTKIRGMQDDWSILPCNPVTASRAPARKMDGGRLWFFAEGDTVLFTCPKTAGKLVASAGDARLMAASCTNARVKCLAACAARNLAPTFGQLNCAADCPRCLPLYSVRLVCEHCGSHGEEQCKPIIHVGNGVKWDVQPAVDVDDGGGVRARLFIDGRAMPARITASPMGRVSIVTDTADWGIKPGPHRATIYVGFGRIPGFTPSQPDSDGLHILTYDFQLKAIE